MHDLIPISALGGTQPLTKSIGKLTLTEKPDFALASITARKGGRKKAITAIEKTIDTKAPNPGWSAGTSDVVAFWASPDQWMVEAPYSTHEFLAVQLKEIGQNAVSVTEQTGGWARFDLHGDTAVSALQRLCLIDSEKMESGGATRTSIDHTSCFVICRRPRIEFSIWVPRSSSGSVVHGITTAMQSIC